MNDDIVILAARRTPIGALMGRLADVPAPQLGAAAIRAARPGTSLGSSGDIPGMCHEDAGKRKPAHLP